MISGEADGDEDEDEDVGDSYNDLPGFWVGLWGAVHVGG